MKINSKTNTFPENPLREAEVEVVLKMAKAMNNKKKKAVLHYVEGKFYCPLCKQQIMDEKKECLCGVEKDNSYDDKAEFKAYLNRLKEGIK